MHDDPTPDDYELAALAALEDAELIAAHSPRFWDADTAELHTSPDAGDPWSHPSWDVAAALAEDGWDDEADAVEILDRTLITDHRLLGLSDTPTGRPHIRPIDEALVDGPTPEEELYEELLALLPAPTTLTAPIWEGVRAA
ncbi:hypothetical protein ACFWZ7_24765 [Nocardiopsis alba]|uniref:hypothetical protein n=1 Tax=Nocardiopsis alba TaxID=53437 RepID=UPI0036708AFC